MKNIQTSDHRLFTLVDAVREWYEHTSGHDVGPKLNKVANAYMLLVAGTGTATERPAGSQDLPPIVPEMIPSPNAQPEAPEPAIDPLEAQGRANLVEATRQAWSSRPTIVDDQARDEHLATSGFLQTVRDQVAIDARRAYEARYHKIAAEVGIQAWTMAYRRFVESGVQECSGKEIEELARTLEA